MKVGFFGDGPWAHAALEKINDTDAYDLAFIVARHPNPDSVLEEKSQLFGVPFYCVENVNCDEFVGMVKKARVDINVSMSFDQIIRGKLKESAPKGFLNCHAGGLPFYRGRNVINWALINGEQRLGVTVHYVDHGIDTGDIVSQRFIAIKDEDTYETLLDRAVIHCAEALADALALARRDEIKPIDQLTIHPRGSYFGTRTWGDEWIDWSWKAERIWNFIRAITSPGPGARTVFKGRQIAIIKAALVPGSVEYIGIDGQVVGRESGGILVKAGDKVLKVSTLREVNEDGSLGAELKQMPRVGARFGRNLLAELENVLARLDRLERNKDGEPK